MVLTSPIREASREASSAGKCLLSRSPWSITNTHPIINTLSVPVETKPLSAVQTFVNNVYANIRKGTVKTPANQAIAEDYVKTGAASLPVGFNAPTGYTLNPSTRILTKKAA